METELKEPLFFMASAVLAVCSLIIWDEFKNRKK
jgi:hypothetical protein